MTRPVLITLVIAGLVLGVVVAALTASLTGGESAQSPTTAGTTPTRAFELPLAESPSAFALAGHDGNLLVGIAARPGGPLEVAVLRAETPVATDALRLNLDGRAVEAQPCGRGCSRVNAPVLDGKGSSLTVRTGSSSVSFVLPPALPGSGAKLFARAQRTMDALRSFRFTERLSSGGPVVFSKLDVQAPDRLRLRTSGGYRSVIIGRSRWDYNGGRWEETPFPGLNVAGLLMWYRAKNPRVYGSRGGTTRLVAFGLQPVPAWFELDVEPSGRVAEAEMLAPSHFMIHRYRDFNGGISITPPVRK